MITKEMRASGLAEIAWGQIVLWSRDGKIRGELTYREWQKAMEPLFLEALEIPLTDCEIIKG
jgi:hypothetical protein